MKKIIGIYKITSPNNRVYIGQSLDIVKRKRKYKTKNCSGQQRVYNSIIKYGWENHNFEVIEECDVYSLNERERYWQDYYNVLSSKGLNCKLTKTSDKSAIISVETREKQSIARRGKEPHNKGLKTSFEIKKKQSLSAINKFKNGYKHNMLGKKHTTESLIKISENNAKGMLGRKHSEETKMLMAKNTSMCKKVINNETNEIYNSASECWRNNHEIIKIKLSSFISKLNGSKRNNTNFVYL